MKSIYFYLVIVVLLLCSALFSCTSRETEPSSIAPSAKEETPLFPENDLSDLGLTDDEIKMLEDRGVANVDSAEVASKIANFTVAVPSYLPDGFTPGKFMINISGAGMPAGMSPKFNNTKVDRTYTYKDRTTMILVTQSTQKFSVGGAEPVDLCGQPAERKLTLADPANSQSKGKLTYAWEKGSFHFSVTGILSDNLGEAELLKVACSINVE